MVIDLVSLAWDEIGEMKWESKEEEEEEHEIRRFSYGFTTYL